jgi:hypothetical protein
MAPKIGHIASERAHFVQVARLHQVGQLTVYRSSRLDGIVAQVPHRPVIACYDTPVQHESCRWVWAVALGPEVPGGVVRSLAIRRYSFPGQGDRRFGWLYRNDWSCTEAQRRLGQLAADMQQQLEDSLAATLGRGALVYLAEPGEPLVRPHQHGRVGSDDIVLVLAAEVAVAAF